MSLRVLVCGGRAFLDRALVHQVLDEIHRSSGVGVVIEGDASGADRLAAFWARTREIANPKFPADWRTHGRAAGPIRNARMLAEGRPDLVVAFPGGRGTADMVAKARAAGIEVLEISPTPTPAPASLEERE